MQKLYSFMQLSNIHDFKIFIARKGPLHYSYGKSVTISNTCHLFTRMNILNWINYFECIWTTKINLVVWSNKIYFHPLWSNHPKITKNWFLNCHFWSSLVCIYPYKHEHVNKLNYNLFKFLCNHYITLFFAKMSQYFLLCPIPLVQLCVFS